MISIFARVTAFSAIASAGFVRPEAVGLCFPYGTAKVDQDLATPNMPLDEWWCPSSMTYGFQGFSYPMGDKNCSAPSNSFATMNEDFARMKSDFGASIVRLYYPLCPQDAVFERAIRAAASNNMALILQANTNFSCGVSSLHVSL